MARRQRSATDYFLGARDLPAWAILLSIVATETSALTVISVPGIGARSDLTFLQLTFGYLIGRIAVARWLLPGYFRGEQETAYARLESRFGVGTRRLTSTVFLVTRFLGDAVRVFASAIPLALVTGWSMPTSIVVMGIVTMIYTWFGGFKAVVWTDVLQLSVYLAGGIGALLVAWSIAGGPGHALDLAGQAGKLRIIDAQVDFTHTYTLLGGLVGGALLSAASHGTDHLIVQRLLATRSLRDARIALIGSGVMVILQFALFLLVGSAIWAAGLAPSSVPGDELFPSFVLHYLPTGLAGLVVAGILAAAMGTHSSAINSLASSATHDLYASWTGRQDPAHCSGRPAALGHVGTGLGGRSALLSLRRQRQRHSGRGARALDRFGHLRAAAGHLSPGHPLASGPKPRCGGGRCGDGQRDADRGLRPPAVGTRRAGLADPARPPCLALVRPPGHLPVCRHRRLPQLPSPVTAGNA